MAIQATVTKLKKEPDPKFGQISVAVLPPSDNMNEPEIWINSKPGKPRANIIMGLNIGQLIDIEQKTFTTQEGEAKQYWEIVEVHPPANGNGEPRKKTYLDPPSKKKKQNPETMKKYIDGHMELLTYAIERSRETWKDDLNAGADVIFKTAVTVYISMKEYFNV